MSQYLFTHHHTVIKILFLIIRNIISDLMIIKCDSYGKYTKKSMSLMHKTNITKLSYALNKFYSFLTKNFNQTLNRANERQPILRF